MKSIVVDAEVVGDLMDDRDPDLLDQLVLVVADFAQRQPVEGDHIGQNQTAVVLSFGQRDPLVETEQVLHRMPIFGDDRDVLHQPTELRRQSIECIADESLESQTVDGLHGGDTTDPAG